MQSITQLQVNMEDLVPLKRIMDGQLRKTVTQKDLEQLQANLRTVMRQFKKWYPNG